MSEESASSESLLTAELRGKRKKITATVEIYVDEHPSIVSTTDILNGIGECLIRDRVDVQFPFSVSVTDIIFDKITEAAA